MFPIAQLLLFCSVHLTVTLQIRFPPIGLTPKTNTVFCLHIPQMTGFERSQISHVLHSLPDKSFFDAWIHLHQLRQACFCLQTL